MENWKIGPTQGLKNRIFYENRIKKFIKTGKKTFFSIFDFFENSLPQNLV
jgi:hypothetical protein